MRPVLPSVIVRLASVVACLVLVASTFVHLMYSAAAGGPPPGGGAESDGALWLWQESQMSDGTSMGPDDPSRYTLEFMPDGRIAVRADCNRGFGNGRLGEGESIGLLGMTRAACGPDSLGDTFAGQLSNGTIRLAQDSNRYLVVLFDGGTMQFERA